MSDLETPVTQQEDFSADLDCDRMDFEHLFDKQFCCAVSTGDRNGPKALCATIHGPYSFFDMCQAVGETWANQQHHMKPFILTTKLTHKTEWLDEGTVDYIESNYDQMILVGVLEKELFGDDDEDDVVVKAGTASEEKNFFDKKSEDDTDAPSS